MTISSLDFCITLVTQCNADGTALWATGKKQIADMRVSQWVMRQFHNWSIPQPNY